MGRAVDPGFEGGIARESSAETAAMHRFRIARMAERPSAQVQDSEAREGYRRREPFKKKGVKKSNGGVPERLCV